jgi:hypothetical protein
MEFKRSVQSLLAGYKWALTLLCLAVAFLMAAGSNKKVKVNGDIDRDTANWPITFGFGRVATVEEISKIDIDVRPDGIGLPAGSGDAAKGRKIYEIKCASCHGRNGTEGPQNQLVGTMSDTTRAKTIGNYWPYSTTVFDYIRRAMPYTQPGSLSDNEVYSLTAFLLYKNRIIDSSMVIDAVRLPKVKMPAKELFVNDDRRGGSEVK